MAGKGKDPADAIRDWLGQWERGVNELANKAMSSEQFARAMHAASTASVGARAGLSEAMERYLSSMNLPSRHDLAAIGASLQALEARVDRIALLVERLAERAGVEAPAAPPAPKPPRTRKPPLRETAKGEAKTEAAAPPRHPEPKPAVKARAKR